MIFIVRGRLDVSVHPFTGGSHPTDVRITTRYSPENWLEGIGGTVHEVGHALYEQGRNVEYDNTPVSRLVMLVRFHWALVLKCNEEQLLVIALM